MFLLTYTPRYSGATIGLSALSNLDVLSVSQPYDYFHSRSNVAGILKGSNHIRQHRCLLPISHTCCSSCLFPSGLPKTTPHFPIQKPLNKASNTSSVPISPVTRPTAWAAYRSSSAARTTSEDAEGV